MKQYPKSKTIRLTPATMHDIVMREDFSPTVISRLSEHQKRRVRRFIGLRLPHCHPRERKILSARLALLAPDANAKLDIWEHHHANVCTAIQGYLHDHAMMPTQAVLAARTGYSRQTIRKHLKAYREHPSYTEQVESIRLMKMKVTEKMLSMALEGDIRAAKVFIDAVSKPEKNGILGGIDQSEWMPSVQNNFIRINGLFITEEKLNRLLPDQRAQLEALLSLEGPGESDFSLRTSARNDKVGVHTINTVNQNNNDENAEVGLPNGNDVHPFATPNPFIKRR